MSPCGVGHGDLGTDAPSRLSPGAVKPQPSCLPHGINPHGQSSPKSAENPPKTADFQHP